MEIILAIILHVADIEILTTSNFPEVLNLISQLRSVLMLSVVSQNYPGFAVQK